MRLLGYGGRSKKPAARDVAMIHSGVFRVRRTTDEVFDLLSNPERFAPVMPDFESMSLLDATHFTMRTVIAIGEIKGHANLAMELLQAERPSRVEYRGMATIAGSPLRLAIDFQISANEEMTDVAWQGEVKLEGMLAMIGGTLVGTVGRENFERMGENLQIRLRRDPVAASGDTGTAVTPSEADFDI